MSSQEEKTSDSLVQTKRTKTEKELSLKKRDGYPLSLHVMVDIETCSTEPNALIKQITAAVFTPNSNNFEECEVESCTFNINTLNEKGEIEGGKYDVSESTRKYWNDPERKDALERYLKSEKIPLKEALVGLNDFLAQYQITEYWAKSPSFDFVILGNSYKEEGVKIPWHYSKLRDIRTLNAESDRKNKLMNEWDLKRVASKKKIGDFEAHDPKVDCYFQIWDYYRFKECFRSKITADHKQDTLGKGKTLTLTIKLDD